MTSSFNTSDILEESSKINESTTVLDGRPHFTPEQHEKSQKSDNPLFKRLQKEAIEKSFVESFGVDPSEKKKRGRPPSVNPPPSKKPSSLKNSREDIPTFAPPAPTTQESRDEFETKRRRKQILEYVKEYPYLPQQVGFNPSNLVYLPLSQLNEIFVLIKQELNPVIEYAIISNAFYSIMGNIEYICAYFNSVVPNPILNAMAHQAPGTFSQYLKICESEGTGCAPELKAIAIEWMGLIPQNPYLQLGIKVVAKGYDFIQFKQQSNIARMHETVISMPPPKISPETKEKLRKATSKK